MAIRIAIVMSRVVIITLETHIETRTQSKIVLKGSGEEPTTVIGRVKCCSGNHHKGVYYEEEERKKEDKEVSYIDHHPNPSVR
jgi:hypothetical protein